MDRQKMFSLIPTDPIKSLFGIVTDPRHAALMAGYSLEEVSAPSDRHMQLLSENCALVTKDHLGSGYSYEYPRQSFNSARETYYFISNGIRNVDPDELRVGDILFRTKQEKGYRWERATLTQWWVWERKGSFCGPYRTGEEAVYVRDNTHWLDCGSVVVTDIVALGEPVSVMGMPFRRPE